MGGNGYCFGAQAFIDACAAIVQSLVQRFSRNLARPAGLEPATSGLETHCSIQLSYGRKSLKQGPKSDTVWSNCQGTTDSRPALPWSSKLLTALMGAERQSAQRAAASGASA